MLGNTAVSASSTRKHCVTLSTSEAEYVAIVMYEDNEGENALAENPQGSHHSKHIDSRFNFLRGLVRLEQVIITV